MIQKADFILMAHIRKILFWIIKYFNFIQESISLDYIVNYYETGFQNLNIFNIHTNGILRKSSEDFFV